MTAASFMTNAALRDQSQQSIGQAGQADVAHEFFDETIRKEGRFTDEVSCDRLVQARTVHRK